MDLCSAICREQTKSTQSLNSREQIREKSGKRLKIIVVFRNNEI